MKQREKDLGELKINERWATIEGYFEILEKKGLALNFTTLVGHGNLRSSVAGYEDKRLRASDKKKMRILLRESLREGAIGISTGLIYPPGIYSDTEELVDLARCCKNLIYTSHMRSEGDKLIESIEEIIRIGKEAGIKVHISHIKTSGKENWHKISDAISMIEDAQKNGVRITCDRYPYTAASTDLDTILPSWAYEGGVEEELSMLKGLRFQKKMKKEILCEHPETEYWEGVVVASVSSEKNRWMEGKSIAYISNYESSEPIDILFKILIEERLRVGAIFSSMNENNLMRFLSLPYVMIGTDSSSRCTSGPTYKGKPHPRGFGSFPRFLGRYVRDYGVISMSEAIHKITMFPAKTFGIDKRGVIKKGAFADLVIFDHGKIIDRATFDEPFLKPEGICYVFVNGKPAIWEGKQTDIFAGRVLRHGR